MNYLHTFLSKSLNLFFELINDFELNYCDYLYQISVISDNFTPAWIRLDHFVSCFP